MSTSRRGHYRVSGAAVAGARLELVVGRQRFESQLIDISAAGAAFVPWGLSSQEVAALVTQAKLEAVSILIHSDRMTAPLELPSRIVRAHEMKGGVLLAVRFRNQVEQLEGVERALLRIFNRRAAVRVEASPKVSVPVAILNAKGAQQAHAVLRDLSISGIGLQASPALLPLLALGSTHELGFASTAQVPLRLKATVRFCVAARCEDADTGHDIEVAHIGLEFDPIDRDKPRNSTALTDWIMGRQLEIRREDLINR